MLRTQRPVTSRQPARAFAKISQWVPAWNAKVAGYERRVRALCWAPPQDKRFPLGELIAADLGLGAPPHDGLRPLDRLLALAIRGAFDGARPGDPEVGGVLTVGQTRDREQLEVTFEAWAKRTGCSDAQRAASIVGLVALTRLQERDGPDPAAGASSAGPRLHLERLVRERVVPDAASDFVAAALEDRISEQDLIREGRALLVRASATQGPLSRTPSIPRESSAEGSGAPTPATEDEIRFVLDLDTDGLRHLTANGRRLSYADSGRGGQLTKRHAGAAFLVALATGGRLPHIRPDALEDLRRALESGTDQGLTITGSAGKYTLSAPATVTGRLRRHFEGRLAHGKVSPAR